MVAPNEVHFIILGVNSSRNPPSFQKKWDSKGSISAGQAIKKIHDLYRLEPRSQPMFGKGKIASSSMTRGTFATRQTQSFKSR
jgi:hypothetical protein